MLFNKQFLMKNDKGLYFADINGKFFFMDRGCTPLSEGVVENVRLTKDNGTYGFFRASQVELQELTKEEFAERYGMLGCMLYIWKNKLCFIKSEENTTFYRVYSANGFECVVTYETFKVLKSGCTLESVNTSLIYVKSCIKNNAGKTFQNSSKDTVSRCVVRLLAEVCSGMTDYMYDSFKDKTFSLYDGAYFIGEVYYSRYNVIFSEDGEVVYLSAEETPSLEDMEAKMKKVSVTGAEVIDYCKRTYTSMYPNTRHTLSKGEVLVKADINGYEVCLFSPLAVESDRTEELKEMVAKSAEGYIKHVKNLCKKAVNPVNIINRERSEVRVAFGFNLV